MPKWKRTVMGLCRREIQAELELLVAWWHEFNQTPAKERVGIVCTFVNAEYEMLMPTFYAGNVSLAAAFSCGFFHFEKGIRTFDHPDHRTSAESAVSVAENRKRKPHERQWPGSIICDRRMIATLISGLPWQGDQSIGAVFCLRHRGMSQQGLEDIGSRSNDSTCVEFADFCRRKTLARAMHLSSATAHTAA